LNENIEFFVKGQKIKIKLSANEIVIKRTNETRVEMSKI
jgi:hypothetical protein